MNRILFVCTGNTCRSPMAQVIANDYFSRNNIDYSAYSRGINVILPSRASENAIKAIHLLYKLNLEGHVSRQICLEDVTEARLILTMTQSQKYYLQMVYSDLGEKIQSIYEFTHSDGRDVKDPYNSDIVIYKECAEELRELISKLVLKL